MSLNNLKVHIVIWSLFVGWETILVGIIYGSFAPLSLYVVHYVIIILLFYFQSDVILVWIQRARLKILTIPVLFSLFVCIYVLFHFFGDFILTKVGVIEEKTWPGLSKEYIYRNLYRAILFIGFSTGYFYLKRYITQRTKSEELEKEKLKAEILQNQSEKQLAIMQNAYLKAQINPHFLFNTLDFVYHHTKKHAPIAGEAIIKLSHMMRFAMDSDQMGETVMLGDELEQVENLIYLHGMRKAQAKQIDLYYDMAACHLLFLPLIVLTLIENVFKHGDLTQEPAQFSVTLENDLLKIYSCNQINLHRNVISSNKGLVNIAERLQYAYGENQTFNYRSTEDNAFEVTVTVSLAALQ